MQVYKIEKAQFYKTIELRLNLMVPKKRLELSRGNPH